LGLLEAVFGAAPVGLAFLDEELRCVKINDALARANRVRPADSLGRELERALPLLGPAIAQASRRVAATAEPVDDLELAFPDPADPRRPRYYVASLFPVRVPNGRGPWVGAAVLDITQRKQAEAELQRARAAADGRRRSGGAQAALPEPGVERPQVPRARSAPARDRQRARWRLPSRLGARQRCRHPGGGSVAGVRALRAPAGPLGSPGLG